ncbi:MAG: hypothetical protein M0005_15040, partial [Actinomycetota bacterium]|nr:hypothetical protein [Actinomycetota bacterium]
VLLSLVVMKAFSTLTRHFASIVVGLTRWSGRTFQDCSGMPAWPVLTHAPRSEAARLQLGMW